MTTRPGYYKFPETIRQMLDDLVNKRNENPSKYGDRKFNQTTLLSFLIYEEWKKEFSKYKAEIQGITVYFLTNDSKKKALELVRDYEANGLTIDEQLIRHIAARNQGVIID